MKRDQYIPHEVSMRNNSEVMNLIEHEGAGGYGIYWALMEYLRVQDNYVGDIKALAPLKREMKIRPTKLDRVLHDYELFVCNESTFYSPKLNEVMLPFERRRAKIETYKRKKEMENLLINNGIGSQSGDIISFEVKGEGKGKGKTSSSKEENDDVVDDAPITLAWEQYVDSLRDEQQWKEIMAMRSGLGLKFIRHFDEVLHQFKEHIQAVGNEKTILSPTDAKRYFCFFNTPGTMPFTKLVEALKRAEAKNPYRFEQRDPVTGTRSYCGVPIPEDAPPRPNNRAEWCDGKWSF